MSRRFAGAANKRPMKILSRIVSVCTMVPDMMLTMLPGIRRVFVEEMIKADDIDIAFGRDGDESIASTSGNAQQSISWF
uniref:Uncharacterized protein n=1 Tax=Caenorhabditis japonica TaxID=281687 RepID=A0A8R1EDW8_CAEJA